MKTIYKYMLAIIIGGSILLSSCSDYLDVDKYFKDRQEIERIFKSKDYSEEWLAYAYYQLLDDNLEMGHVRFTITNYADDAVFNEGNSLSYANLKAGIYDPNKFAKSWKQSYIGIRQASIFLKHIDMNKQYTKEELEDVKGQAYFIRGYLYWLLLRKYGPIPILPDDGLDYEDSYDKLSTPRSTYDECVEYISKQMIEAAKRLPAEKRNTRNVARPTKGAALATRAKAYLYAASPLMNGNPGMVSFVDHKGRQLISQEVDNSKWAKAAAASLDVIKLNVYKLHTAPRRLIGDPAYPASIEPPFNPNYSNKTWAEGGWSDIDPFESYRSLFTGDLYVSDNEELIFTRGDNQLDVEHGIVSLTKHQMPGVLGGHNMHGTTVKQTDAYGMNDGKPFNYEKRLAEMNSTPNGKFVTKDESDSGIYGYNIKEGVWKEYVNREPRFYASIAFNGMVWTAASARDANLRNKQVWYYRGEPDGRGSSGNNYMITGIGRVKFVNPKDTYKDGDSYPKVDPALRYADVLLMYAEALNEVEGTYNIKSWDESEEYSISRNTNEMKTYFSQVRVRAGVPDVDYFSPGIYNDVSEFRKAIKRERQIEFYAENQRYFDLRRWLDAEKEEGAPVIGCNTYISKDQAEHFYERMKVPQLQAQFSTKMYFWPVTYDELKRNKFLTQAPGWQSYD